MNKNTKDELLYNIDAMESAIDGDSTIVTPIENAMTSSLDMLRNIVSSTRVVSGNNKKTVKVTRKRRRK